MDNAGSGAEDAAADGQPTESPLRDLRDEDAASGGGDRGAPPAGRPGPCTFKALCPDEVVAGLIGYQGQTRQAIEKETGARIQFSGRGEFFPGTRCRIVVVSACTYEQVLTALSTIVEKIVEVAGREESEGKGGKGRKGSGDGDPLKGKEPGEFIFRSALPALCTGAVIGPRGTRIQAMREGTGSKVFVDRDVHEGHQMNRLIGSVDAIGRALQEICEIISSEVSEDKLVQWAATPAFAPAGREPHEGGRKGGSKRSRSRSRGRGGRRHNSDRDAGSRGGGRALVEPLEMLADEFPPGRLGMDHVVSCELPRERVDALIGRRGDHQHYVEKTTNTQISFAETSGTEGTFKTMTVMGSLIGVYAAHMMMMKKYHEIDVKEEEEERERQRREEERRRSSSARGGTPKGGAPKIEDLQNQIANLSRQLEEVRSGARKGGKGTK